MKNKKRYRPAKTIKCLHCTKPFETKKDQKYCSRSCARKGPGLQAQYDAYKKAQKAKTGNSPLAELPPSEKPDLMRVSEAHKTSPKAGMWRSITNAKPLSDLEGRALALWAPSECVDRWLGRREAVRRAVELELGCTNLLEPELEAVERKCPAHMIVANAPKIGAKAYA